MQWFMGSFGLSCAYLHLGKQRHHFKVKDHVCRGRARRKLRRKRQRE